MEVGALLVAQESVGGPDLVPAVVAKTNLVDFAELVSEARVPPRLTQVHAYHVILHIQIRLITVNYSTLETFYVRCRVC